MEIFGLGSYPGFFYVFPVSRGFFVGVFPGLLVSLVDTYPKLRVIFLDVFITILFFRLSWTSIKRSGLLRHNKSEMLLVVTCVLLGSLLLRAEIKILYDNIYSALFGKILVF